MTGPDGISPRLIADWLNGSDPAASIIIADIRLPRVIAAAVVGASLGLCGAALQALTRNPLAEPGILGVSAAARSERPRRSISASRAFRRGFFRSAQSRHPRWSPHCSPAAVRTQGMASLILTGVGLSSLAGALMALILNFAPNPFSLSDLVNWTLGSVANRSFSDLAVSAPLTLLGSLLLLSQRANLSLLSIGEAAATAHGSTAARPGSSLAPASRPARRSCSQARSASSGSSRRIWCGHGPATTPAAPCRRRHGSARCCSSSPTSSSASCRPTTSCVSASSRRSRERRSSWRSCCAAGGPAMSGPMLDALTVRAGSTTLLDGITATIAPGRLTAIVGPNGAGKSTLLRAIANIIPSSGGIRFGDTDLKALKPLERAHRLAYLPQAHELAWDISVADMVALGRFAHGAVPGRSALPTRPP
jgi:iron complex transport system permease protein